MIRFNRTELFWYGIALIFLSFVGYKCFILLTWEKTTGHAVAFDVRLSNGQMVRINPLTYAVGNVSKQQAVIEFTANNNTYNFLAVENLDIQLGDEVPVIYSPKNPQEASVNDFFGFWFRPLWILPIIIWSAIVMGLTGKHSFWNVSISPFRIYRTDILRGSFRK